MRSGDADDSYCGIERRALLIIAITFEEQVITVDIR